MYKYLSILGFIIPIISTISCQKESIPAPIISFENTTDIYSVKIGKEVSIEPIIKNDYEGLYFWEIKNKTISTEKILTNSWDEIGQIYISFKVITEHGEDKKEIRVDVYPILPPKISLNIPENGHTIMMGTKINLKPDIVNAENAEYIWLVDSKEVSKEKDYSFSSEKEGLYKLSLTANNEDGEDKIEFDISVKSAKDMPFSWEFEYTETNLSTGRKIRILPYMIKNAFNADFIWAVNGIEVQRAKDASYIFAKEEIREYKVTLTMSNDYTNVSQEIIINVCSAEGTYERTSSNSELWNKVYEYCPAPGQFINENIDASTMEEANRLAETKLKENSFVSLGGFGGYIVVGFDHSIKNDGDYNIQIHGNSFKDSSEPGIVWVMQDENGDGLPNDTWYELKGSEYEKTEDTIQDYYITYFRPNFAGQSVNWIDCKGESGQIDYLAEFYRQDYYYPTWVKESKYTLKGTRLKSKTVESSPGSGYWKNNAFDWGYADNFSSIDMLSDNDNSGAIANANHFKINNAVCFDRSPANLSYIDFVKIQTGVNAKAGRLGENSTDIFNIKDYNLVKNK